jgi:hypothetical protein
MHTCCCEMGETTRKKLSEILVSVRYFKLSDLYIRGLKSARCISDSLHGARNFSRHTNDLTVGIQK